MNYAVLSPGMLERVGSESTFSIPPINDNIRKMDAIQQSVAVLKTADRIMAGEAVYATLGSTTWEATRTQTGWGCLGVAIMNSVDTTVRVQLIGQALARSVGQTSAGNIGKFLQAGGNIVTAKTSISHIIGQITGVADDRHYEVLLHAKPLSTAGFSFPGIPFHSVSDTPSNTYFATREAFVRWYDDASDHAHGRDNYFDIIGKNTLITSFGGYSGNNAYAALSAELVTGSASMFTYNHKAYDHVPQFPTYDIRPIISGTTLTMVLLSSQTLEWAHISEFDATIQVTGWWK